VRSELRTTGAHLRLEQIETSVDNRQMQRPISTSPERTPAGEWTKPLQHAFAYGSKSDWKGWDPYDGLRSPLTRLPLLRSGRAFRLGWIQIVKRSPWNFRSVLGVSEHCNAKTLALVLSAAS